MKTLNEKRQNARGNNRNQAGPRCRPETLPADAGVGASRPLRESSGLRAGRCRVASLVLAALAGCAGLGDAFGGSEGLVPVELSVTDAASGAFVPARITLTDTNGALLNFRRSNRSEGVALRRGLVYTRGTPTTLELPPGIYHVYATRGMEWSRAERRIVVRAGVPLRVPLAIVREVDTTGFIAADTHIHTLTFSGHGDASVEERVLTLAGEGVELAVATDHNHNTDYRPVQEQMRVNGYFTAVTGNEVTTRLGHMNAFPLDPKERPPDHRLGSWIKLVNEIRSKGAKVVILNHPRWPTLARCPFTEFGLNPLSGEFRDQPTFPFDAVELANSLVPQPDPLYVVRDWLALLNRGYRVTGVGASDTHTVGEPPGQARSYLPSRNDDPARIDVDDACERFRRGEVTMSLGIFADVWVDGRWKMGQTNTLQNDSVEVTLRVAAPSWVTPRVAIVFLNGREVARKPVLSRAPRRATDARIEFRLPRPGNDAHLVCAVLGDGVSHPAWTTKEKFTLAVTNPVFLDADGDGRYASPHAQALAALQRAGESLEAQWAAALATRDDAVAIQMLSLMRQRWPQEKRTELEQRIRLAGQHRPAFRDYIEYPLASAPESARGDS